MMHLDIYNIVGFVRWWENPVDERTSDWFLVPSIIPVLSIVICYTIFVKFIGPPWMKNRHALDLGLILPAYNFFLVALNFYIAKEMIQGAIAERYSIRCQPINKDPSNKNELKIANATWWYFFSKIIELFDTVWFVVRKRDRQVTFLHVYHHSTMPLLWWVGVRWVPGGEGIFGPMCNSLIHVLMYSYYGLSSFGPKFQKYLWWKRHITMIQMLQFVVVIIHTASTLLIECDYPKGLHRLLLCYMLLLLALFINFYMRAYRKDAYKNKQQNQPPKKLM